MKWFVGLALFLYLSSAFYLYANQDSLIFLQPAIVKENKQTYQSNEFTVDHNGVSLRGWLMKSNRPDAELIIYFGGNAEEVSRNLKDYHYLKNYSVLYVNYRGFGESEGAPSQETLFDDALFIYDYMNKQYEIQNDKIIVMGRSLGSGVASYVASQRSVKSVILVTPYDSILEIAKKNYPVFPIDLMLNHPFNSISIAPKIKAPALVLMAEFDSIIPKENTVNLINAWGGEVKTLVIKKARHNSVSHFPSYWSGIKAFLEQGQKT